MSQRVHLVLPAAVLEDLLRRHQLHIEQLQCLDKESQAVLEAALKNALIHNRRH